MSDSDEIEVRESLTKSTPKRPKKAQKNIEEEFQKVNPLDHVLLRPDTYVGSVEFVEDQMWVYDNEHKKMVQRKIKYCPGLYKIFDEIIVNAADNKQRDPSMSTIKIDINPEKNEISVWNDGEGIPVVMHKTENMYVPSLIFGHLLTSSNFNDSDQKTTGGRNGYGAKLCNIFSTKFIVETSSKKYKSAFKQEWRKNMRDDKDEPVITPAKDKDFTKITFSPDLAKFRMDKLDRDIVDLMSRRAYDIAGVSKVKVYLNKELLKVSNFKEYIDLYTKENVDDVGQPLRMAYDKFGNRWEVAVTTSDGNGFDQISFVNSIATTKGGRHVDYVTEQLVKQISAAVNTSKNKTGGEIKTAAIKSHLWVFVNCLIENPTFDSQTKENMTLQKTKFGSKCEIDKLEKSSAFVKALLKTGVTERVLAFAKAKAEVAMGNKMKGSKTSKLHGIPKLEDANDAGTRKSLDCTLILTEGDSAKSLVMSGFSVVGRDKYGVFPLRGKLLNVREATPKQVMENAEINNIIKIMGLQMKKKYDTDQDMKTLRYGHLMIMTDQDQDGSHIKGLLINFIQTCWPSLLRRPNFLVQFITPIVKITKKGASKETRSFYSLPELEEWKKSAPDVDRWNIKYYKGLGTSTSNEAKEYFKDMGRHQVEFKYSGEQDDKNIKLAFGKDEANNRKDWLLTGLRERKEQRERGDGEVYLYGISREELAKSKKTGAPTRKQTVTYTDFINKELILFSNLDNERSIPSMVDGLKPGQRKVLFTCFKRNDKREVKVAQLAGSVGEHSAYHHGEASLMQTIIGLAQDYWCSNNINLLMPQGQFGTRLQGGKDAASPRYIFTLLSPLARKIFHPDDSPLLNYLREDNQKIEPDYYVPIIPMVLVNGADGIGTGWMTKIPCYNPEDIVANIRSLLNGRPMERMTPWYRWYRGTTVILPNDERRCITSGEVAILNEEDQIEITELPIRKWTQDYKEAVLEPMLNGETKKGKESEPQITDYKEYHTDKTVRFVVSMTHAKFREFEREGFHQKFKLQTTIPTTSMVLFGSDGCIRTYDSPLQILQEFFTLRLARYGMRKNYLNELLTAEALKLENQARFIEMKIAGAIKQEKAKEKEVIAFLLKEKFDSDPVKEWKKKSGKDEEVEEPVTGDGEEAPLVAVSGPDYDYLLDMKFRHVHIEYVTDLLKRRDAKIAERDKLRKKSPEDLWNEDLDDLMQCYRETMEKAQTSGESNSAGGKIKKGARESASKANTKPSGERIEPLIDAAMILKFEKAKEAKDRKDRGEVAPKGRRKVEKTEGGEGDEKKPKKEGGSKLKQTTLDSKVTRKKKNAGSEDDFDDYDSQASSDSEEDDIVLDDDSEEERDDYYEREEKMPKPKDRKARSNSMEIEEIVSAKPAPLKVKAVAKPVEKAASPKLESKPATNGNGEVISPSKVIKLVSSDEDDDMPLGKPNPPPAKKKLTLKDDYDYSDKPKPVVKKPAEKKSVYKKPAAEKKPAPKKRARASSASSEEFVPSSSRAVLSPKKPKQVSLDDSEEEIMPRVRPGRKAAPKQLLLDSSLENAVDATDDDYLESIDD